jgi:hypothetical protein
MSESTKAPAQQNDVPIEKFVEELTELGNAYNKCLDVYGKVQESSAPSENAMYKIALTNVKRPSSYVSTEDEKTAEMAAVMDFVESRQELISAQAAAFKALQLLQNKQSILVNYVNKINGDLEKKLSELTVSTEGASTEAPVPSRSSK